MRAQGLSDAKYHGKIRTRSSPTEEPNSGGVGHFQRITHYKMNMAHERCIVYIKVE